MERHRNNHPIVAVVGDGWWGDMMPECNANLRLMTDAPLILDAYNKKCKEVERLREALQIITKDLDSAIAKGHLPIIASHGIDATKIRNFANDASL